MIVSKNKNNLNNAQSSLYGLVLAGGHSTRMDVDKSMLDYHGKSQVEHCCDLLSNLCGSVFISNREDQSQLRGHKNFPQIHDIFHNIGPLGGILSAMSVHPDVAWLVLACDLPLVNKKTIELLIRQRDRSKIATAFKSIKDPKLPEPLCAIYETKSQSQLKKFLDRGIHCPRKILISSDVHLIVQDQKSALNNINNQQEYHAVVELINTKKHEQSKE